MFTIHVLLCETWIEKGQGHRLLGSHHSKSSKTYQLGQDSYGCGGEAQGKALR